MKMGSAIAIRTSRPIVSCGFERLPTPDSAAIHVEDDRAQRDLELADGQLAEALVERRLDRFALGDAGEPPQRRQGEPDRTQHGVAP